MKPFSIKTAGIVSLLLMLFAVMASSAPKARAADKPPCDKPLCREHKVAMEPNGIGGHYCLQCMQDMINQQEDEQEAQLTQLHADETLPMETGSNPDDKDKDEVDTLTDQMDRSRLLRDPGQASGGYVASSTMVGTGSGLSLPAGAKYSFDTTLVHKGSVPTHDDSHTNLGVEVASDVSATPHLPGEDDPSPKEPDTPMVYQAPMTQYHTSSEPQFMSAPVQVSEGSSVAHNLIKLLKQEGYGTSGSGGSVLPSGEGMLLMRGDAELNALISILSGFNIELAAHSLSELKTLLLSDKKVIIRMIQKDGTITVIHIHPVENNQALIITEVGMQSVPVNIDEIITLLNTFLVNEEVTLLTLFTHAGVTDSLPTAPLHQTQGASTPASLTTAIIEYIQQQLKFSAPQLPPAIHNDAIYELQATHDQASLALLMPTYGFQPGSEEGTSLQNIEELSATQTSFMAQLIAPNQQATVINFQPDSTGGVTLTLSGQHFVIDRRDVGQFFDWIINQFRPVVRIFILAALFI
ncbi:MAG: hypothetical protein ACR2PX_02980 [Endozoicomonas sp.]|uniref:hypothetical protein n=1 Tax=Endozoicomonas sp. TaxID=1892382 RepID=UPI003D9ACF79